jgi:ppGpp synthetase/RelA/SpoT-type nucleotidyltranferase
MSRLLDDAKDSFIILLNALVTHAGNITISKIDGRVKEKEECIRKFNRKYRTELEAKSEHYSIQNHITDLIGLRIVCLYEDDIEKIRSVLVGHFDIIEVTDKIAMVENTEGSFGYKGLHLDLRLNATRTILPEYTPYAAFAFEVQVRTIIQDSWSVLDHKIKYKKSIPNRLKRRINTLAALFELADREFREIRESTEEEIQKAGAAVDTTEVEQDEPVAEATSSIASKGPTKLDAFSFLRIAQHFFEEYEFEPRKVDGFTQEVSGLEPGITRGKFNLYMRKGIARVKRYQAYFENKAGPDKLNPFTIIRHCLYLGKPDVFNNMLTNVARDNFDAWLAENPSPQ